MSDIDSLGVLHLQHLSLPTIPGSRPSSCPNLPSSNGQAPLGHNITYLLTYLHRPMHDTPRGNPACCTRLHWDILIIWRARHASRKRCMLYPAVLGYFDHLVVPLSLTRSEPDLRLSLFTAYDAGKVMSRLLIASALSAERRGSFGKTAYGEDEVVSCTDTCAMECGGARSHNRICHPCLTRWDYLHASCRGGGLLGICTCHSFPKPSFLLIVRSLEIISHTILPYSKATTIWPASINTLQARK